MIATMNTWERRRWALLTGLLMLVILVLLGIALRPAVQSQGPASVIVQTSNGPTVLSTQVVPLR